MTYCPLTGTAYTWSQSVGGVETTFGVSGFLYNSNLILFDRATGSHWAQMLEESVQGTLRGEVPARRPWVETRWDTWQALHPETRVVSSNTGYDRGGYTRYPYTNPSSGDYRHNDDLLFPVANWDTRLDSKARVVGVLAGGAARAYPLAKILGAPINDTLGGSPLVIFGDAGNDIALAFSREVGDQTLSFERVPGEATVFPYTLRDLETGSTWTVEGRALDGPLAGEQLARMRQVISYWFAWAAFHPDTEVHGS